MNESRASLKMTNLVVSSLISYPLKSARGIEHTSMQLNHLGPELDRRWMVIDPKGKFITQRKVSQMCLIQTSLNDDGLVISAAGAGQCEVPKGGNSSLSSSVWGSDVIGEDCGDHAADWLSNFLGKKCRIIYMPSTYQRLVDINYANNSEQVGFADGFPLLIATQSSLDDFNTHIDFNIEMNRFRPNIVISGNHAWAEDNWRTIEINGIQLKLPKPCSRCIMPSVNPNTAERQMEINSALLAHRRGEDKRTYFGQNAVYNKLGSINVGDSVKIIDTQESN